VQTTIEYNGILLQDVLTEPISHDVVYESTGVDQIGMRVVVTCTANVHTSANDFHGKKSPRQQLGAGINVLLNVLLVARRPFRMMIGNSPVYDIRPGAAARNAPPGTVTADLDHMDIEHGPKPRLQIMAIRSGNSATIQFSVEFIVPICGGGNAKNNTGLVNFRFWIVEDIDCRTWLTSRTYTGRLRVAHKNIDPRALAKQIAIPPQQRGFKRQVVALNESEDGLHLDFTVRDEEIIVSPPWSPGGQFGAVSWDAVHQVSTQTGAVSYSDLSVTLTGPKTTSKENLFLLALKVFETKTHYQALRAKTCAVLEHFGMKDVLKDNTIEVSGRIRHTGGEATALAIWGAGPYFDIGKPLGDLGVGFDDQISYQPGPTATLAGLFLSVLQTPCEPARMPQNVEKAPPPYKPEYKPGTPTTTPPSYIPQYEDYEHPSPGHLEAMYLDYRLDSDLIVNNGRIALPTGASSASQGNSLALVQLYRDTAMRHIALEATRVGKPPELPTPNVQFSDSNGIQHVQIGQADVTPSAPILSADARKLVYGVHMEIRYAMDRAPRVGESVAVGCLPYRTTSPGDTSRTLPATIFVAPEKLLA